MSTTSNKSSSMTRNNQTNTNSNAMINQSNSDPTLSLYTNQHANTAVTPSSSSHHHHHRLSLSERTTTTTTTSSDDSGAPQREMNATTSYHHEQFKLFKQRAETEKKQRRRRQNNESSRRSRERKRQELESLQRANVTNQLRISELEGLVRHLSSELSKHDGAFESAMASAPKQSNRVRQQEHINPQGGNGTTTNKTNASNKMETDERPGWFGSAF